MDILRVQRWVMSALVLTVATLFASGLAVLSLTVEDRGGSRVGLMALAAVVGLAAIVGVRLINVRAWLTGWLVLGLLPAGVAAYFAFFA
jgi:hypothetical protein